MFHGSPAYISVYAVLELSIPLRQLGNDFVWTRCSVTGWNALAKAHHVPSDEAMPGRFMFVQLSHCEASPFRPWELVSTLVPSVAFLGETPDWGHRHTQILAGLVGKHLGSQH